MIWGHSVMLARDVQIVRSDKAVELRCAFVHECTCMHTQKLPHVRMHACLLCCAVLCFAALCVLCVCGWVRTCSASLCCAHALVVRRCATLRVRAWLGARAHACCAMLCRAESACCACIRAVRACVIGWVGGCVHVHGRLCIHAAWQVSVDRC